MLVHQLLENSARVFPAKTALTVEGRGYAYGELNGLADRCVHALLKNGLSKGDRVVIWLENSLEAVVGIFGALKAGCVFVMVSPIMKPEKLSYILNDCSARALICNSRRLDVIDPMQAPALTARIVTGERNGRTADCVFMDEVLKEPLRESAPAPVIDADLAAIIYTSGSTGNPKGVTMNHHNMISAANSITEYLGNTPDDVILNTLPMSFDYGLYQVITAFKAGASVILEKGFTYPYKVIRIMKEQGVTGFPIVPTISAILTQMDELKNEDFPALRYITNTAAALPVPHIKKLSAMFPKARLFSMYGLTECKRVSYLDPAELGRRPDSVGKAMPNTEVFIVDENGERVGPGIIGELVVRGSSLMQCYWGDPEETAKKIRPGSFPGDRLLFTGDLFRTDDEGFLYFIGRKDDIIKCRGEKISPKEIENTIYALDGVVEAAVVGVPDPVLGQSIKAFIVKKNGITENDVLKFCSERLDATRAAMQVVFVAELPKTSTGKIKKDILAGTAVEQ